MQPHVFITDGLTDGLDNPPVSLPVSLIVAQTQTDSDAMSDGMPMHNAPLMVGGIVLGAVVLMVGTATLTKVVVTRSLRSAPRTTASPTAKPNPDSGRGVGHDLEDDSLSRRSRASVKTLSALGLFVALSGGIVATALLLKPPSLMADMDGMAMEDMSMEDMMRVDGAPNPVPVTVEVVQPRVFEAGVSYTGSIKPVQEAVVYPRVAGQLTNYSVYPGDRVIAGQVLADLIADERSTELAEARAEAETMQTSLQVSQVEIDEQVQEIARLQAELDYLNLQKGRFATLTAAGATSQNEYDAVAAEAAAKAAALEQARAKLTRLNAQVQREQARVGQAETKVNTAAVMQSYTTLQAPISGIVQARLVDPGVVVQPGMGVLKIGDYSRVRLQANVAQQDAGAIQVGTPVLANVPGALVEPLEGSVTSLFPQANDNTRTVVVEALIDNPQGRLLSGQYLEMTLVTGRKQNALSVPQTAVAEFNSEPSVWVMVGTTAERRPVETGMVSGNRVEIISGLDPGDQVITSGYSRLVPGVQVAAVDDAGNLASLGDTSLDASQGNVQIQLISPLGSVARGDNPLTLQAEDAATGAPLPVSAIAVTASMAMPNMAPMQTEVEVKPGDQPGRFQVNADFAMAGTWQVTARVDDGDRRGQTTFTLVAR